MTDIALVWNNQTGTADWSIENGDLKRADSDLETAVLLSLFTDRRADPGYVPIDGKKRGAWTDTYADFPIGSTLWQYKRATKAANTNLPASIQSACLVALQWLIDKGVAQNVSVTTGWLDATTIGLLIVIRQPNGSSATFQYPWAWEGI